MDRFDRGLSVGMKADERSPFLMNQRPLSGCSRLVANSRNVGGKGQRRTHPDNSTIRHSGEMRSFGEAPSAWASSNSVTTVGLRRPCSSPLMYCCENPESSATRSCVSPRAARRRAKFRPTRRRMSMTHAHDRPHAVILSTIICDSVGL